MLQTASLRQNCPVLVIPPRIIAKGSIAALKQKYAAIRKQIQPQINKLMAWDLSKVKERLVNVEKLDADDVDRRILEYKRFLCLRLLSDEIIPVSQPIDVIWHTHILFTKDYVKMSNEVFGSYCHHNPTVNDAEKKALSNEYAFNTIPTYKAMFGKINKKYWPHNSQCCDYDVDCSTVPNMPRFETASVT